MMREIVGYDLSFSNQDEVSSERKEEYMEEEEEYDDTMEGLSLGPLE